MTSRSLKNHQTIRANTRRWKPFELTAWSASLLLSLAPLTQAAEDTPSAPAVQEASSPRAAEDRWKRLKSQYGTSAQPGRSESARRIPAVNGIGSEAGRQATEADTVDSIRTIPSSDRSSSGIPVKQASTGATSAKQPYVSTEKPLEWVPMPNDDVTEEDPLEKKEISFRSQEKPSPEELNSVVPGPVESSEPKPEPRVNRGTERPETVNVPSGPPRRTTQIRKISDIAPYDDMGRDQDIRTYADERAREFNIRFGGDPYSERNFPDVVESWAAPNSRYYPLYFQDPALERYGHTYHPLLQPVVSSLRFSGQLVMMPYQMAIVPPWELQSPLGWYRPGDVVPKLHYPFPWNTKAAVVEAATVTGLIFLVP